MRACPFLLLAAVLAALKLGHAIAWPWLVVLLPIYLVPVGLPALLAIAVILIGARVAIKKVF